MKFKTHSEILDTERNLQKSGMENIEMRMVEKAKMISCMKCPICDGMYREATTICECLHTFCKECIYKKLEDEKEDCCPECNIYLGALPLEKLRSDHAIEVLKENIFPSQQSMGETSAFQTPINTEPVKIQVANSVSSKADSPGIQLLKPLATEPSIVQPPKADTSATEPSLLQTSAFVQPFVADLAKIQMSEDEMPVKETTKNQEQDSSADHADKSGSKDTVNPTSDPQEEVADGNEDLNEPLRHLVVTTRSKNIRVSSKRCGEESSCRSEGRAKATSNPQKPKRNKRKNSTAFANSVFSSPKPTPSIWLSLVASEDQEGDNPLPQISQKFLRLKNEEVTVSVMKRFLMKKFDLESEEEVELKFCGKKLLYSEVKLKSLVDLWVESGPSDRIVEVAVGSSAEEFVMVLTYGRSSPHKDTTDAHCPSLVSPHMKE